MKTVKIVRYAHRSTHTLGLLYVDDVFSMYTLELPERGNEIDISRIPVGTYDVVPYNSSKHGECYKVLDVIGRTNILIHVGNWSHNTRGCILIGTGQVDDGVTWSAHAMRKLDRLIGDDTIFTLTINDL